ncbi:MAG: alanine--tRNA ligase, partial [Cyclobacteriaceae bacterium]|nr:alanine--tRNA ligase [Cyclobacteriaceae bacterium]
ESSVAAGVRRIEAVTGEGAFEYLNHSLSVLQELQSMLKNPKDMAASLQSLLDDRHSLEKKLEEVNQERANRIKDVLATKAQKNKAYSLILEKVNVPNTEALKNIAYALRNQFDDLLLILAADVDGKPQVCVMTGEKLAATNKFHAGNMVKELAKEIDGGGGGQPFFATAGGKKLEGLDNVLVKAKQLLL